VIYALGTRKVSNSGVLEACNGARPIDIRDKAILLLLARLGLRASDVASLKFDDIDWLHGTFTVIGKPEFDSSPPKTAFFGRHPT
jgi:integrase